MLKKCLFNIRLNLMQVQKTCKQILYIFKRKTKKFTKNTVQKSMHNEFFFKIFHFPYNFLWILRKYKTIKKNTIKDKMQNKFKYNYANSM